MGASSSSGLPPRPYAGCTSDPAWQRAGLSEAAVFDVYEIGGLLGSGAFGQVRICWPKEEGEQQKYAVKVVDTKSEIFTNAAAFLSARNEASILRLVEHPHIVELIDVFERDRFLFLVMEYVGGGELFGALADPCVPVTEGCVGAVGHQLFQALNHLHDLRIIHRDVKAENILLQSNPAKTGEWHIKLVDFGLATRTEATPCIFRMCREQEAPLEELICGTAYYCAPEVWVNDYGPKVDVWAAGVVLYLALLGTFPFYDKDPNMVEVMICNMELEPSYTSAGVASLGYRISDEARQCLEALLAKDHDDRLTAEAALNHRWLKDSSRQRPSLQEADKARRSSLLVSHAASRRRQAPGQLRSQSALLGDDPRLLSGDQVIPFTVRSKAGRAAARPPVEPSTERGRTEALEGLRRQRLSEPGVYKVGNAATRMSWRSQSRDIEVPQKDRELPAVETSFTDSDVDDAGPFCCH